MALIFCWLEWGSQWRAGSWWCQRLLAAAVGWQIYKSVTEGAVLCSGYCVPLHGEIQPCLSGQLLRHLQLPEALWWAHLEPEQPLNSCQGSPTPWAQPLSWGIRSMWGLSCRRAEPLSWAGLLGREWGTGRLSACSWWQHKSHQSPAWPQASTAGQEAVTLLSLHPQCWAESPGTPENKPISCRVCEKYAFCCALTALGLCFVHAVQVCRSTPLVLALSHFPAVHGALFYTLLHLLCRIFFWSISFKWSYNTILERLKQGETFPFEKKKKKILVDLNCKCRINTGSEHFFGSMTELKLDESLIFFFWCGRDVLNCIRECHNLEIMGLCVCLWKMGCVNQDESNKHWKPFILPGEMTTYKKKKGNL